ncbi:THUMP domain-containing protein [Paracandidimonas soli]|uniref:Putative N6-adenine-specific DNA methylase n=1 Tax=Paracandidimonas soli TaxID=1917182 RepID=A0A4R3V876_9BURK|nr:THUMP domain-containing protein [Paracandidimonas soli]TCV01296.1 putative N6-adenine-specific DNA methylase [Paracandidimonas soli]
MADDTPRKTLSLKKSPPASGSQAEREAPRQRTGARAKAVAQARFERRPEATDAPQDKRRPQSPDKGGPSRAGFRPVVKVDADRQVEARRPSRASSDVRPQSRQKPSTGSEQASGDRRRRPELKEHASRSASHAVSDRPARLSRAEAMPSYTERMRHRGPEIEGGMGRPHLLADTMPRERQIIDTRPGEQFPVFAPCPQGLEQPLAEELTRLGFADVKAGRAGCRFRTDWAGIQKANLHSRLATRILVQVARSLVAKEDDILELARATPWEQWFGPDHTLRVDTSAIRSPMQSLQYCNLRAKDGICDRLREREGSRPSIDTVRPDARVHLFLDERSATLYLDTSGESLFKRGWRLDKGEAPLRENLASGLLALSGWKPGQTLLDPFCGSGTILIEAAGIALGAPPGIWRPFAFERLRNHNDRLWHDIKDEARAGIATRLDTPLFGRDLDENAIQAARANAKRAWLAPDAIDFRAGDALAIEPPSKQGWIVTNPPYGERLDSTGATFWRQWAEHLKRSFSGWQVAAITSDLDLPKHLRLKPRQRIPLHNGALDCRLFLFEMVAEGYRS